MKHVPTLFSIEGWVLERHLDGWTATNNADPRVTLEAPTLEGIEFLIKMREGKRNG